MTWKTYRKKEITPEFIDSVVKMLRDGSTLKQAALKHSIPPAMFRAWLEEGLRQVEERNASDFPETSPIDLEGQLWDSVAPALSDRNLAELKKVDDSKWKLERFDAEDFGPAAQRVEISGPDQGPIAVEGRAVVGIADVVKLAIATGQGHLLGLPAGVAGELVPPVEDVLSDPAASEPAAGALPAPEL